MLKHIGRGVICIFHILKFELCQFEKSDSIMNFLSDHLIILAFQESEI